MIIWKIRLIGQKCGRTFVYNIFDNAEVELWEMQNKINTYFNSFEFVTVPE